jgi:hypothetical protein
VLQGPDEEQVRAWFGSEKLAFFAKHKGLHVEGGAHQLLYYRARKQVAAKSIQAFVEEGLAAMRVLGG